MSVNTANRIPLWEQRRSAYEEEHIPYLNERYHAQKSAWMKTLADLEAVLPNAAWDADLIEKEILDVKNAISYLDDWLKTEIGVVKMTALMLFPSD